MSLRQLGIHLAGVLLEWHACAAASPDHPDASRRHCLACGVLPAAAHCAAQGTQATACMCWLQAGDLRLAIRSLQYCLELSQALDEHGSDSDILGDIADVFTDLGDLEQAGQFYDKCIAAMSNPALNSPSASWDC